MGLLKKSLLEVLLVVLILLPTSIQAAETKEVSGKQPSDSSKIVVADVNGHKITMADIEMRLRSLPPAVRIQAKKNRKQFVEGLVQAELLFQEALKRKFDESPEVKKRILRAKRRILIDELLKHDVNKKTLVTDSELRAFFESNKERFRQKEAVTLSHIVVKTEKEAWDALAEIRRGIPFAQVARERSIFEATRDSGGVMGTAERGTLEKKVEDVAFKLPIGQVSDPIQTSIGWQIIRVNERTAAAEARYEDVKDDVKLIYAELKRQERYQDLMDKLRKNSQVKVYLERFK